MVDCLIKGGGDYDCVYVDSMLGWLAKMLRIVFGLVVYYKNDVDDSELLQTKCLVVTRDWELFRQKKPPAMFFATDDHVKWIAAFLRQGLAPFVESRCPQCGGVLKEYSCKDAEGVVGHAIRSSKCWRCVECGHVYWVGSHWRSLKRLVEEARRVEVICTAVEY
ncbi:MAG: Mut7-C RNAse domain-containing protein [Pyrobaculum sp.]